MIQGPGTGPEIEIGTPRSLGTPKSLKFISTLQVSLPSPRGGKRMGKVSSPPQAVLGSVSLVPSHSLHPWAGKRDPGLGKRVVPGFSLQARGHTRPAARRSGAYGARLGAGGASPRAPARCAAATQRQSSGGSDAMVGSQRPKEGSGSAAHSGRTPAGLAAEGAEGGGGTRPQAPPGPGPAPSRPSFFALRDFCA